MPIEVINSNFTSGEITPLLEARVDFEGYYKGARKIRNLLILPQGGVTRRFGLRNIADTLDTNDYTKIKLKVIGSEGIYFLFIFTNNKITIYEDDVLLGDITSPYSEDIVNQLGIEQNNDKLYITHEDHKINVLQPAAVAVGWELVEKDFKNSPTYDFKQDYDDVTFTPSAVSGTKAAPLTLTATGGNPFNAYHVGGLFFGNEGTLRITTFTSPTSVQNATRGYPRHISFYQGRMVIASTKDLPGLICLSATNELFEFDDSTADPSDPIIQIITGRGSSNIKHLIHSQDLFVFTESGEFSTPPFTDKPSSPENTYFQQQTENGISDVEPVSLDNRIIFVDKGGKIVREMLYTVQRSSYEALNISLLSAHLINNPISIGTFKNPSFNDGVYMLLLNEDGTLPIYQSIEAENIKCWMLTTTDGKFKQVGAVDDQVYFLVERTINEPSIPETKLYLEKIDFGIYTDSTKDFTFGSPQSIISGLEWLNGKEVWVTADGFLVGKKEVHGNSITLDEPATTVSIGLEVKVELIPPAVNIQLPAGQSLYLEKRIKNVYVDYYESLGIKINELLIPSLTLAEDSSLI
jgi:hypothetical protein